MAENKGVDENEWLVELLIKINGREWMNVWIVEKISGWEWMTGWIAENKGVEYNEWIDELLRIKEQMKRNDWMNCWVKRNGRE